MSIDETKYPAPKKSNPNSNSNPAALSHNVPGVADVFAGATAEAKMCRRPKRGTPREATTPCYLPLCDPKQTHKINPLKLARKHWLAPYLQKPQIKLPELPNNTKT